jgi:hypothetical protein
LFTGLALLSGGVQAQTEPQNETAPAAETPGQQLLPNTSRKGTGSSYQPGAEYTAPSSVGGKGSGDKTGRAIMQEQNLRRMMASFGVTELDIQNAIIVYVQDEVQRRQPLREQGRRLYKALKDETISTAEMTGLLTDFRAVVEADKARRTAAEAALNTQTGYTTNPRLEAMLLLFGVIGDAPTVMTVPVPYNSSPKPSLASSNEKQRTPEAPGGAEAPDRTPDATPGAPPATNDGAAAPASREEAQPELGFSEAQRVALLEKFDFDGDGELDSAERNEAREFLAREFLARGLWPPARKKTDRPQASRKPTASRSHTDEGNAPTNEGQAPEGAPEGTPVPRIPGPLPVIPANAPTN